jgi:transcriptional regulator with XRE-family HTH domain
MVGPRAFLEDKPTPQSIKLGGRYINMLKLSEATGFSHSYVSRILAGKRSPTIPYLRKVAEALYMTVDDLLECIEDRRIELEQRRQEQLWGRAS